MASGFGDVVGFAVAVAFALALAEGDALADALGVEVTLGVGDDVSSAKTVGLGDGVVDALPLPKSNIPPAIKAVNNTAPPTINFVFPLLSLFVGVGVLTTVGWFGSILVNYSHM